MSTLEGLNRELVEIQDALLVLGDDEFAEKYRLQVRRDKLRAARRTQLDAINDSRFELVAMSSGGSGEAGASGLAGLGDIIHRIADAQGVDEINARIARFEAILSDRGVEFRTA
jgi:hypothetical protein